MQKPIGSKDSVQSVTLDCSGDIVDDSGTYTAVSDDGKHPEGSISSSSSARTANG
ncbi:MAG: hypothetical protein ABSE28_16195 [Candidatus Sulfotelmatobacter sp.]|jgi:hypothetical protein